MSFPDKDQKKFYIVASFGNIAMRYGPFLGPQTGKIMQDLLPYQVNIALVVDCGDQFDLEEFLSYTDVQKLSEEELKDRAEKVNTYIRESK